MSSISLPRVLQPRRSPLEIERENFEKSQAVSIAKAINDQETPVKEKHVRSAIIGTHQEKGAHTFWVIVLRLPHQDNRIVAWKFCHVLHKVLREGHHQSIIHSQSHRGMIQNLGKLWCHLQDGYGKLIDCYTKLLITKLEFHRRNPRFPGHLNISRDELENIGENDINNYFEMSVEMFDYLDDILTLQCAIFGSLDPSRSNSMTLSGQCRLAPLIPCIQDSSRLYDFCVQILFRLHLSLPPDTLVGHRERFLQQFRKLREFYENAANLQYFRTLIQITLLPENPPNFLTQADLRTYVAPVVVMPAPEPDPPDQMDGFLIDTTSENNHSSPEMSMQINPREEELEMTNRELENRIKTVLHEHNRMMKEMNDHRLALEAELASKENELIHERSFKENLAKANEQAREKDDLLQKLKSRYATVRDEHAALIRSKAEVDKQLSQALIASEATSRLRQQIDDLLEERSKNEQTETKLVNLRAEMARIEKENQSAVERLETLTKENSNLEASLQELRSQKENLDVRLKEVIQLHEEVNLKKRKQLLELAAKEGETLVHNALEEIDNPALSASTSSPDYLKSLAEPVRTALSRMISYSTDSETVDHLAVSSISLSSAVSYFIIHCRTTGNSSPDIELGEKLAEAGKEVGKVALKVFGEVRSGNSSSMNEAGQDVLAKVDAALEALTKLTGALKGDSSEVIADLVEHELADMEKAIEAAALKIEELTKASREKDSGIKLEVNEKILDSCTGLMAAIRILVQKARLLQAEVVAQGKGQASAKEFYKRNHRWTEGLISAAKAVASGATFLLSCADKVVCGEAKFEPLIVASQEIAASTAQLVVASRVKADRNSSNLKQLGTASKSVTQATAGVVAAAKSCSQLVEDTEVLDVSKLSLHQAKRLEMDSQVRVLELEAALQQERVKLSSLRRHHYQLAGDAEGWDVPNG